MKLFRKIAAVAVMGTMAFALAGCSKVSQSYANKIDKAAEKKEFVTYDKVKKDLGDEAVFIGSAAVKTGVFIAVKGCKTTEDIKKKIDDGKDVKGIIITVTLGNAIDAQYTTITADSLKA